MEDDCRDGIYSTLAGERQEGEACFVYTPDTQNEGASADRSVSTYSGTRGHAGPVLPGIWMVLNDPIPPRNSQTWGLALSGKGLMLTGGSKHRKSRPEGPALGMQGGDKLGEL